MEQSLEITALVKRLNRIGIALSAEHNLGPLLEMIVTELRSFTSSDGGSLYIKHDDALSFEVAQNDTLARRLGNVPFKTILIPIDTRSIAGYVAATGNPVNIPDLDCAENLPFSLDTLREFDRKMELKTVSMLVVPMKNNTGEIIGVVQLLNSLDDAGNPVPYTTAMEELVTSLASQAAVAISNSMLIADIKRLFESLVTYSAQAIDARSPHTAGHSMRVSQLVMAMAAAINRTEGGCWVGRHFTDSELDELRIASWLHDIGKIGVREAVLDKRDKLSEEQISAIVSRFAFLQKEAENRANIRRIGLLNAGALIPGLRDAIERDAADEMEVVAVSLAAILAANRPGFLPDGDIEHLEKIAARTYRDLGETERPWLEPSELEHLRVQKGNLTGAERAEIESHIRHTMNLLEKIPFTEELRNVPRYAAAHHEMLDGSGYPMGLRGDDIALQSRIIAVADIYDALTAKDRPYKPPLPVETALRILRDEAEKGRLDANLVDLFISERVYETIQS